MNNKQFIKELLPPLILKSLRKTGFFNNIHWSGDFSSWTEASNSSVGYDSDHIVEKVKNALLKVKNNEAAYERDSVLYDEIQYSWPVLSALLWVYSQEHKLNIIDFGGSLGSTYFQNRKFLTPLREVTWNIIEQKQFVDIGINEFQDQRLKFYHTIELCLKETNPNCILLSSVLPYIEKPFDLFSALMKYDFKYLILDKMPFIEGDRDRITVQNIPSTIYKATYPAWFFSERKFKSVIEEKYEIIEEFLCPDEANIKSVYKGMILKLK